VTVALRFSKPGYIEVTVSNAFVQFGQAAVPTQALTYGDLNNDGFVDLADLRAMVENYNKRISADSSELLKAMDVSEDQWINLSDMAKLARNIRLQ